MSDFKAQFITYFSIEHDNFSILNLFINQKGNFRSTCFFRLWEMKLQIIFSQFWYDFNISYLKTVSSTIPSK